MKLIEQEALAERDWWNEIATLFGTRATGWSYRSTATFQDGTEISNSRVAAELHRLVEQDVEVRRLRAQRDLAWLTLSRVEDALGTCNETGLAFILASGHTGDSAGEWNAVLKAWEAAGGEGGVH